MINEYSPVVLMNVALVSGTERCRRHTVTDSLFITANIKPLLKVGGYDGAEVNGRKKIKIFYAVFGEQQNFFFDLKKNGGFFSSFHFFWKNSGIHFLIVSR